MSSVWFLHSHGLLQMPQFYNQIMYSAMEVLGLYNKLIYNSMVIRKSTVNSPIYTFQSEGAFSEVRRPQCPPV